MATEPVAANQPANPPDPAAAPPGAPAAAAPAPAQPAQQGKNVILPSRAFTERLKKAEEKGRTAYQAELDKQAQERGFANHAAMLQHLDAQRTTRTAPRPAAPAAPAAGDPPAPPKNRNDRQAMAKYEQDKAKWKREQDRKDAEIREQKRLRRKAENRANAIEVKATLERIAHGVGIKDTDYAVTLFTRAHEGKTEDELKGLDEEAFFKGLRTQHPYLFGEVTVPATTGTSGPVPGSHAAPRPGATAAAAGAAGKVDVREMTKPEFEEYKRARGIRTASTGLG